MMKMMKRCGRNEGSSHDKKEKIRQSVRVDMFTTVKRRVRNGLNIAGCERTAYVGPGWKCPWCL